MVCRLSAILRPVIFCIFVNGIRISIRSAVVLSIDLPIGGNCTETNAFDSTASRTAECFISPYLPLLIIVRKSIPFSFASDLAAGVALIFCPG